MISYELMELLEHMPDEGAFKRAASGGEFTKQEKIWAQIANELAVLRAAYVPKAKADQYESKIWFSAAKLREMIEEAEQQEEVREDFYSFADRSPEISEIDMEEVDV